MVNNLKLFLNRSVNLTFDIFMSIHIYKQFVKFKRIERKKEVISYLKSY